MNKIPKQVNKMPSFNVLDEPWIPVRTLSGQVREVGLADALLRAGEYSSLAETSPPNLIALYRLLLATLHRALTTQHGAWKDSDRARWFQQGLPEAPIRAYLDTFREKFWLFHAQDPFMQVAALADAEETRDKHKPWTQIALDASCGNTPVMFDHACDELPVPSSIAAMCRNLIGFLAFTPGGLVKTLRDSDKAGGLANTAAVMPIGERLSESLLLGLHPYDSRRSEDLPAWEQPTPTVDDLRAPPVLASGPNDRYTRRSRAVLLLPDAERPTISQIRFAAGLALADDASAPDPMASYRFNKEGKAIRISFIDGRAIWRDLPSLVPDASGQTGSPARILAWAAGLYEALGRLDLPVRILTAGLASDQAKLLRWRIEQIVMPPTLLLNPDAAGQLRLEVLRSDEAFWRLRGLCTGLVAATMPDPDNKDTRSRAKAAVDAGPTTAAYFQVLERALPALMQAVASGDDSATERWTTAIVAAMRAAWAATCVGLGNSPAAIRAEARHHDKFLSLIRNLRPAAAIIAPAPEEISV
jgi:CRISPR system Cascade subunit CasA